MMAITPERKAEIIAALEKKCGPLPKVMPKVVTREDAGTIRDADVAVSRADKNYPNSDEGIVRVRRPEYVTINIAAWEEQQRWKAEDRRRRRELDPFRIGHWGPLDDNED
jgi:hypothetical protein